MTTIYTIPCTELHNLMARMKPATAKASDYTPVLERVRLTVSGERVTAVATDRYRLHMDGAPVISEHVSEEGQEPVRAFTLPGSAADDFKRLGFAKTPEFARLEVDADGVTVATENARLTYPSMDADYPHVGRLLAGALEKIAKGEAVEVTTAYNVDYLADFAKVRRAGGISKNTPMRVHQVPAGANAQLVVTFAETDFWALLMSVRIPEATAANAEEALNRAAETARETETVATA